MKKDIFPGKVWLDTKGERIQAHGAGMFYEDGVYYWYGFVCEILIQRYI